MFLNLPNNLQMNPEQVVREKYHQLHENLSEQQKRLWAASEALSYGYGGVSIVHRATGLSRPKQCKNKLKNHFQSPSFIFKSNKLETQRSSSHPHGKIEQRPS